MASDIRSEIARRLDVAPDDVAPVLETAVGRIRQQVAHYGYARLSGLGTFRRRDDGLVFEPDPALAEAINARFAGLHDLILEPAGSISEEETERPVEEGLSLPEIEADRPLDEGASFPETQTEDQATEDVQPTAVDREDLEADELSPDEEESETFWNDLEGPAEKHPLGPESEPPYEEADFSVLGEQEHEVEDADTSSESPTVSWAPLGPAEKGPASRDDGETRIPSDEEDAAAEAFETSGAQESAEEIEETAPEGMEHGEIRPRSDRLKAPDRTAEPHGLRSDGPVRTIHPPSRRSKERRDPKPIWFGVGIIVLVAAAAVAYFMLPDRPQEPAPQETTQAEAQPPPDTATTAAADAAVNQESDSPAQASVPPAQASEPPALSTPLRSDEGIDPADGGYTIVVYSDVDQNLAEEEAERYRDEGFRSSVLSSQQDGVTRYRVGVGQFATLEEAAQQRNELAEDAFPSDAWVMGL